ncbi:hypothetical protein [uncultured Halovibrio sp.]|uniref:hypothetical protein n=1 Tax=uncultured Halovibrio sp. TaxID=985049 RepID=UPI0025FF2126|nr:hypothetical protein [uncultured Halovibrio sp.]
MIFIPNPCDSLILGYMIPIVMFPVIPLMILAYPLLGRYFDRKVHNRESPDFWIGPIGTFIARPVGYAFYIVVNVDWEKLEARARRRNPDHNPVALLTGTYGHIDFRGEANTLQVGLSWLYVLSLSFTVLLAFIYAFCKYVL